MEVAFQPIISSWASFQSDERIGFSRTDMLNLSATSKLWHGWVVKGVLDREIDYLNKFSEFLYKHKIIDYSTADFSHCENIFDIYVASLKRVAHMSLFFHHFSDLDKARLWKTLEDDEAPQVLRRMIAHIKSAKEIKRRLSFTAKTRVKMIDFLFVTNQVERLSLRTKTLYEMDFKGVCTHHQYALIHAPFLNRRERDLLIRDFFQKFVFPDFKKESMQQAVEQLTRKIKNDEARSVEKRIYLFLKMAAWEFFLEGHIVKCLTLGHVIDNVFYACPLNVEIDRPSKSFKEFRRLEKILAAFIDGKCSEAEKYAKLIVNQKVQQQILKDISYWFALHRIEQLRIVTK